MNLIEEIKRRINIVDLATEWGLQPTPNNFIFSIYKAEKNRSLKLYPETNSYYCFATGKGGDVIRFYADYYKINNGDAIKRLANELQINHKPEGKILKSTERITLINNIDQDRRIKEIYAEFERFCDGCDDKTLKYLTGDERGLSEEIIKAFRIFSIKNITSTEEFLKKKYTMKELMQSGLFNNTGRFVFSNHKLIIPYLENGEIVYLRGRLLPENENQNMSKYIGLYGITAKRFFNTDVMKGLEENSELMLCEGEFDAIASSQYKYNALGVPGVNNFPANGRELLSKYELYICFDNDEAGEKGIRDIMIKLEKNITVVKLKKHKDLTEYFAERSGGNLARDEDVELIKKEALREKKSKIRLLTAREIQEMELPAAEWIVEGLIPEGLIILAGRPKIGKSWMALGISISVANGTKALGSFNTKKSKVLYIALEDNKQRLKNRIVNIIGGEQEKIAPVELLFLDENFNFPKINEGGLEEISNIIDDDEEIRMVVIDTLGRSIADKKRKDNNLYLADYEISSKIQELAMKRNISIMLLHHTKKGNEENVFDEISGTTGLTGAMDTMMVIKEKSNEYTLHIRGRDVEEAEYRIEFDKNLFCWNVTEKKEGKELSAEREEILTMLETYNRGMGTGEIAELLGKKTSNISKLLKKLMADELIISPKYGIYELAKGGEKRRYSDSNKPSISNEGTSKNGKSVQSG